jgi:hypothetical protein
MPENLKNILHKIQKKNSKKNIYSNQSTNGCLFPPAPPKTSTRPAWAKRRFQQPDPSLSQNFTGLIPWILVNVHGC